jgi:hypothetical protein
MIIYKKVFGQTTLRSITFQIEKLLFEPKFNLKSKSFRPKGSLTDFFLNGHFTESSFDLTFRSKTVKVHLVKIEIEFWVT